MELLLSFDRSTKCIAVERSIYDTNAPSFRVGYPIICVCSLSPLVCRHNPLLSQPWAEKLPSLFCAYRCQTILVEISKCTAITQIRKGNISQAMGTISLNVINKPKKCMKNKCNLYNDNDRRTNITALSAWFPKPIHILHKEFTPHLMWGSVHTKSMKNQYNTITKINSHKSESIEIICDNCQLLNPRHFWQWNQIRKLLVMHKHIKVTDKTTL
jgi:hypothetical protein